MSSAERHRDLLVPAGEIARRLAALQAALAAADIAAAWIDHPPDRTYLSGSVQDGVVIVPASGAARYLVKKSLSRAMTETGQRVPPEVMTVEPWPGRKALAAVLDACRGAGGRVGLAMDVSPAATYAWIREERGAPVADIATAIRTIRATKSEWEHAQLREAGRQAERIYDAAGELIRPGMSELELTAAIEGRLRAAGHGGYVRVRRPGAGIAPLSAVSGESAFYPTPFDGCVGAEGPSPFAPPGAGWKRITTGETVMLDMVTWWNGYICDQTRTWWTARAPIPDAVKSAHDFCVAVLHRLEAEIRPGARCDEVYRKVRAWVDAEGEPPGFMGAGENRVKFFGHGVGLELDEMPVIADRIEMELRAGMVIAIEPKAFIPGVGPVGVENTCIVTPEGPVSLCCSELALSRIAAAD